MLWGKCKKLCVNKLVNSSWLSNGFIRLKLPKNERSYIKTHINDLKDLFPGNKFFRDKEEDIYCQVLFLINFLSLI